MKTKFKSVLLMLLLLPFCELFADELRVEPLEYWKETSYWQEDLSVEQLIESSLHASGVRNPEFYIEKLNLFTVQLNFYIESEFPTATSVEKGEAILHWMHEHILTGHYVTQQTKIDVLLDEGDYNCVSSAILYLVLTRSTGLMTRGEETKDHAFCTLTSPKGESVDIETTTTMGFDPGTKKEFDSDFEGRTGFAYVKPGDYSRRQSITDKKLVSLIMQNRLALYQQKHEYDKAVGIAVDRWFFYPIGQHEKDMNDSFRNWVSHLNQEGEYVRALEFLIPLSQEMGFLNTNKDLVGTLIFNQTVSLVNGQNLTNARFFLDTYHEYLSEDILSDLTGMIDTRDIEITVNQSNYDEALKRVREFKEEGRITPAKANELLTFLHQNQGVFLFSDNGKEGAEAALDAYTFLSQLPQGEVELSGVKNHREQYLKNWAIYIHNDFVEAANAQNYEKAKKILSEALLINKSSTILNDDLEQINKLLN